MDEYKECYQPTWITQLPVSDGIVECPHKMALRFDDVQNQQSLRTYLMSFRRFPAIAEKYSHDEAFTTMDVITGEFPELIFQRVPGIIAVLVTGDDAGLARFRAAIGDDSLFPEVVL